MTQPREPDTDVLSGVAAIQAAAAAEQSELPPAPPPSDEDAPGGDDGCPVRCHGHLDGIYSISSPSGELRRLDARGMTANGIASLFDGDDRWLIKEFPRLDREGGIVGFRHDAVARWLMRRCAVAGHFDPSTPSRGVGVWPHEAARSDPPVIVHAGDALWIDGGWIEPGGKVDGAIFAARPKVERPDMDHPADSAIGAGVLQRLRLWPYTVKGIERLLLGQLAVACLGAAAMWRPSGVLTGERGGGKSTLLKFCQAVLGAQSNRMDNVSGPGFRQAIANEARTVIYDEAEGADDGSAGPAQQVVELIRTMSGGEGGRVVRGGMDGHARHSGITGSVMMACILGLDLKPQDRSRITEYALSPLPPLPPDAMRAQVEAVVEALDWGKGISAAFRARCLRDIKRFLADFKTYRSALAEAGCDMRQADQLAAQFAGYDLVMFDEAITREAAIASINPLLPIILDAIALDQEESEGRQCWNHLMSSPAENWSGGNRRTISQLVMSDGGLDTEHARILGAYGLRLTKKGEGVPAVMVANQHNGLERIFAGTRWARRKWARALKFLPLVTLHPTPVRFAGLQARALRVPVAYLPSDEADDDV